MHAHDTPSQKLAIGMAALSGYIDALGYLILGRFFVSFMSGNSTLFAAGLVHRNLEIKILMPFGIIIMFIIGVMLGRTIRHFSPTRPSVSVLAFVSACLTFAAVGAEAQLTIVAAPMMAIAMGAANNVFVREGEVSIGVTYMTGTLVKFGQRLAGRLLGDKDNKWGPYLLLWLGLMSGAILGAVIHGWQGRHAIWLAVVFCVLLAFTALRNERSILNPDLD